MIERSRKWVLSSGWVHYLPLQALWPWAGSLHSLTLHFPINKMMLLIVPTSGVVRKVKRMSSFNILLSQLQLFVTPWTVAHEAPLSMGFSRQENWSGLLFPLSGDLPNPGIKPGSPAGGFFPISATREALSGDLINICLFWWWWCVFFFNELRLYLWLCIPAFSTSLCAFCRLWDLLSVICILKITYH